LAGSLRIGRLDVVLNLLRDLHSGTGARVRLGSATSDFFKTTSGVPEKVVTLGRYTVMDLDYADDNALPAVARS